MNETKPEPAEAEPVTEPDRPTLKVSGEQAFVVLYFDLAIQNLIGMGNQLRVLNQHSAADQFSRSAGKLMEKRDGYVRGTQRVQLVGGA